MFECLDFLYYSNNVFLIIVVLGRKKLPLARHKVYLYSSGSLQYSVLKVVGKINFKSIMHISYFIVAKSINLLKLELICSMLVNK